MPELGTSGSVRGVSRNGHPYRDPGSSNEPSPDSIETAATHFGASVETFDVNSASVRMWGISDA